MVILNVTLVAVLCGGIAGGIQAPFVVSTFTGEREADKLLAPLETGSSWSPFTAVLEVETSAVGGTAGDLSMFWPNCCWELLWLKDGLEEEDGIVCLFSPGDIVGCVADSSKKKHYSYIIVQGPIHPQQFIKTYKYTLLSNTFYITLVAPINREKKRYSIL